MAPEIWPFHARAFLGDTEKLTAAETGAYVRLLIFYWHNHGLPNDDDDIRRITGLPELAWRRSVPKLRALFKNGWRHERADRDLAYAEKMRAKQRANINRRWHKNSGDNFLSGQSYGGMRRPQQNQTLKNAATHTTVIPKEITDKIFSISSNPAVVQKWPSNKQANSKQHRAQQSVERQLLRELGPDNYATAIERLSKNPELVERATQAELREPGSGALVAMIGLHREVLP